MGNPEDRFCCVMAYIVIIVISTVNSESFVRVLFSRNFTNVKFYGNETLGKWRIHLTVYWSK